MTFFTPTLHPAGNNQSNQAIFYSRGIIGDDRWTCDAAYSSRETLYPVPKYENAYACEHAKEVASEALQQNHRFEYYTKQADNPVQNEQSREPRQGPEINPTPAPANDFYAKVTETAKTSITFAILNTVTEWRNKTLINNNAVGKPKKCFVLIAAEMVFIISIPLAAIELVVRLALGLIVLMLKKCGCIQDDRFHLQHRFLEGARTSSGSLVMSLFNVYENLKPTTPLTQLAWLDAPREQV